MRGARLKVLIQSRRSIRSILMSVLIQLYDVDAGLTFTIESNMWPAAVASFAPFEEYINEFTEELVRTSPQAR